MDKNTIIGIVLIAAVLIGYSIYTKPSDEEILAEQNAIKAKKELLAKQEAERKKAQSDRPDKERNAQSDTADEDTTRLFYHASKGTANRIVLKNENIELTVNSKGGTIEKAVIRNYKNMHGQKGIVLFDKNDQHLSYRIDGKEQNINTADLYFTPSAATDSTLTLTAQASAKGSLSMTYRLGKDYLLHLSIRAQDMEGIFPSKTTKMNVEWNDRCRQQEKGFVFENRYATLTYKEKDNGTDHLSETSEVIDQKIENNLEWVAFKNQFFSAVMIPKGEFSSNALLTSIPLDKESGYLKQYKANLETTFDPTGKVPTEFEFFYGPNDFSLLQKMEKVSHFGKELDLERLVYLGWPLVRYINRWFTLYVFDWLTSFGFNMGVVLILITLLLKAITFPLVKKSYMSSAKMRVLKPKLDEATRQYDKPEDQMQKQQAMMQMYAQYGVSPLSGCLPVLIQMPIWIAMFNFVPNAIQLRGQSFLWIDDLSTYDPIIQWPHNLWLIGDHISLTCILFCVANVLYTWMTMRQQRDQMVGNQAQQMKMMQYMMYLMPVMFFFMFNDYSAGLNFYYFVSLFFSALIMWTLRKTTNDTKLLAILEANYKENKNNPKKMSGLAARLEAMQKQQQEMQRKRAELENRKKGL
ncbi:MAG: membrane protein insertase YidC [Prevotella sp.]|nr:membrane protein insertase YidC [Prevotella sp.]